MKKHKKILFSSLIIILCLVVMFLIYYYPLQRVLAEKKLDEYMTLQGVDAAEIESMEYHKDYKQDGYSIFVTYADDEYQYVYRYYLISTGQGDNTKYNSMYCDVYDSENQCMDEFVDGMKYRSLEWELENVN